MTRAAVLAVLLTALVAGCATPGPTPPGATSSPAATPPATAAATATSSAATIASVTPWPSLVPLTVADLDPVDAGHWVIAATDRNLDGVGRASVLRKVRDQVEVVAVCAGSGTLRISAILVAPATDPPDPEPSTVPLLAWTIPCQVAPKTMSLATDRSGGYFPNLDVAPSDPTLRYDVMLATVVGD